MLGQSQLRMGTWMHHHHHGHQQRRKKKQQKRKSAERKKVGKRVCVEVCVPFVDSCRSTCCSLIPHVYKALFSFS